MSAGHPSSRLWVAGGVVVALLIVVVNWFLFIGPTRSEAQTLRADTEVVEGQNAVLQAEVATLREQADNRGELESAVKVALSGLPAEVSLPEFNRQVLAQAAGRSVEVTNISVSPSTTVGQTTEAAAEEDGSDETSTSDTTDPVPTTGALSVPVTIQTRGPALAQLRFLRDIQEIGPRRALVGSIALTSEDDADTEELSTLTIQLHVFAAALSEGDRQQLAEALGEDFAS